MSNPRYHSLSDYLRRSGETQEALAARLGVTQPTISRIAAGYPCSLRLAKQIAAETGIPIESLGSAPEAA